MQSNSVGVQPNCTGCNFPKKFMPPSKNALLRYATIDECLQSKGRRWSFEELRQAVEERLDAQYGAGGGISVRTLREDLKNMRPGGATGYNAPLEVTPERGYHYTEPGYSIFNTPLTVGDLSVLHQALGTLKQLQGLGLAAGLQEVVDRLELRLSYQDEQAGRVVLQFEQTPSYQGQQWLNSLYAAVRERQALWLTYQAFQATESRREVVHPYLLKQYNGRWFLVAQRHGRTGGASVFALDRVQGVETAAESYQPSTSDPASYFKYLIGVSILPQAELLDIRLRFAQTRLPYVLTKPLHPTQQVEESAAGTLVRLQLVPTRELLTLLLSFGADVEVVDPAPLREQIKEELKRALLLNYPEVQASSVC
ncbi:WYL domain-containing protein [Hymenobacter lutimineralis]|uniref:WYL domain-containing protein n=1 Tax=Hymenobacter lutimineralis TaxID=2606448 RepID=A0A5D6VDB1_9BACT|nr:WYL domain-containing protein [Hymenobacter lutimineralis]TYZ12718.1 WYL domain-containing protein [Hymenobacter lutimineralis]